MVPARGIVEFRTNQRARAREIFEEGVRSFPTSAWLNYGLGQEYEAQGRIDEMAACFRHVRLEPVGSPTVLEMARYYYLWSRFEHGQRVIQPIFDRYYELKIADDMFLYMRGLPMFDESFGYRATFAWLAGKLDHARLELVRARSELSDLDVDRRRCWGDWLVFVVSTVDDGYAVRWSEVLAGVTAAMRLVLRMSRSGLASSRTRSASLPGAIVPAESSIPK